MTTIRTEVTLWGETWKDLRKVHREVASNPYLPHTPRIAHDMISDALSEWRERADIWQAYRECSVCGLSGSRAHGDVPDCDSVTVQVMMTTAQARRIMEWADTICTDDGLTFTTRERVNVRAFANQVAEAHDMELVGTL